MVSTRNNWRIAVVSLIAIASLGACTPAVITRINSKGLVGNAAIAPASFAIIRPIKTISSAEWNAAQDAVVAKLSAKSFVAAEPAVYSVEITLSSRPANLALSIDEGAGIPSNGKQSSSSCVNNEYRLTIGISRIADGALVYQGAAAETHCKDALSAIVPVLVDAAMTDLGAPRGSYNVQRIKPHLR